jgi:histidine ammonia-lyase
MYSFAQNAILREANSCSDNPIIFSEDSSVLSGGNFHGESVAMILDFLGISFSELGSVAERRIFSLTDSSISGLPPFLAKNSGLNSGFMLAQVTAASLCSENRTLAHPACVDNVPTSANQEDFVSMGNWAGLKLLQILRNLEYILSVEFFLASQGLEFRLPLLPGKGTKIIFEKLRSEIQSVEKDRVLSSDIEKIANMIRNRNILEPVENSIGGLEL